MTKFSTNRLFRLALSMLFCSLIISLGYFSARLVKDSKREPFLQINSAADVWAGEIKASLRKDMPTASVEKKPEIAQSPPLPGVKKAKNVKKHISLSSIFFPIEGDVISVPKASRAGSGGALTSVGENLVLLNHAGEMYNISALGELQALTLAAPDSGFASYMKIANDPAYSEYQHKLNFFRYNDILFTKNGERRFLLISHTKFHEERLCYTTTVSRLDIPGSAPPAPLDWSFTSTDWNTIFETSPCLPMKRQWRAIEGHMAGGRMASAGDGAFYLANGDYAWDGIYGPLSPKPGNHPALSQDPGSDYGKVLKISILGGEVKQVSLGHRNVQGITLDEQGRIWTVEHGMRGGDELNLVSEGMNFGWPLESYGTSYAGTSIAGATPYGVHELYTRPIFAFLPSIATSGLELIEGFHEAWNGDMLIAALSGLKLVRVRVREGRVIFAEDIPTGFRTRYVHQHSDGRLALWTDDRRVIFLSPSKGGEGFKLAKYVVEHEMKLSETQQETLLETLSACMECHSLNAHDNSSAPSLAQVYGSRIGSQPFDHYSDAMSGSLALWNSETLEAFLEDPQAVVPGSIMPAPELSRPEIRSQLAQVLKLLKTTVQIPAEFL